LWSLVNIITSQYPIFKNQHIVALAFQHRNLENTMQYL
jgi:hypothetical protein